MKPENLTALALKYSVVAGFVMIVLGEGIKLANGWGSMLKFGILFLIISPLIAVAVTTISLYVNKERKWTLVALLLIAVSVIGMAVSYFC